MHSQLFPPPRLHLRRLFYRSQDTVATIAAVTCGAHHNLNGQINSTRFAWGKASVTATGGNSCLQLAQEAGLGNCESCLQAQNSDLNYSCSTAVKREVYWQMNFEKDSLTTSGRPSGLWSIPCSGRGSPDMGLFFKIIQNRDKEDLKLCVQRNLEHTVLLLQYTLVHNLVCV